MTPFTLLHSYRVFKANNRYSYPMFFFMMGTLKNTCQIGAVTICAWVIYTAGHNQLTTGDSTLASSTSHASSPTTILSPVEIPAVASHGMQNSRQITESTRLKPVTSGALQHTESGLHGSKWVFKQDERMFTIQYASSPDIELITQGARSFSTSDAVAVFPFKKNRNKQMVYGFSAGIYDSVKSAQLAIAALPESTRALEPWIRPIGELQEQVARTLER